jgi:siroheme decarboxylase
MTLDAQDQELVAALGDGLPLDPHPFAIIAERAGMAEDEAIARTQRLVDDGVIKRFGLVVRHHELGYRANAMVVWDLPDGVAADAGAKLAGRPEVTLCYRRERRPSWPYNLYVMIHGRDRSEVMVSLTRMEAAVGLVGYNREVLFSRRRFKQTGARYSGARQ